MIEEKNLQLNSEVSESTPDKNQKNRDLLSLLINGAVICFVAHEIVAVISGKSGADKLLIVSIISGAMTIISYNLSKKVLSELNESQQSTQPNEPK